MNIVVCVKQTAYVYVQDGFDPRTKALVTHGLVYMINPHDEAAVEAAIRLKEDGGGSVSVITLGPERCETALRWCLAMGADSAVHAVWETPDDPNPWETAGALAGIVRKMEPDLVLFGKKAIDDEMGQVGTFAANLLDLPVVTAVTRIAAMDAEKTVVHRALDRGNQEEVVCPIPAVLTVDKAINRPRYPTFPARKSAQTKPVEKIAPPFATAASAGAGPQTLMLAKPKLRPKKILSPDSSLSAAARINFVMTGGMGQKKGATVGGSPDKLADGIIDFLRAKKVLAPD